MGVFRKKRDPISERAQALTEQIEALEAQIKNLAAEADSPHPKFRSSAVPRGSVPHAPMTRGPAPAEHFEPLDHTPLQSPQTMVNREQNKELGVRKYDIAAAWRRLKNQFQTPPPSNPKLVNYLAAGSIKGLRPLRYEKRVARNRFIFLVAVLLLVLWGIIAVIFKRG
jgi:hypothetical protein